METIAEDSFYFPKEEDKEGNHNHKTSPSSSAARGEERGGVRGRGEKKNETEMGQKTNDLSFPSRSAGDDDRGGGGGGGGGGGPEKGEEEEGSEEEEERTEVDTEQDKDEKPDENKEENSSTTPGNSTTTSPITEEETPPQASSSTSSSKTVTPPTSLPLGNKRAMKPPAKNCFRLVVLGASRVGKTSIVSRFLNNKFEDSYTPTIEDFHRKLYRIRGDVYQLDILDTSGNHPFPAMRRLSFLTGDLFVLVFSWDSRESWDEILRLREQILETKQCASASLSGSRRRLRGGTNRVPMVIAGNKKDKEQRVVTQEEVHQFVSSLSCCAYMDVSAKLNYNVDKLFYELFVLANLPMEMSPALHKRVCPMQTGQTTATSCPVGIPGSSSRYRGLSIRRRLSDAYGMVAPNVRRPSIRTDLLILRAKTSLHLAGLDTLTGKKPRKEVSCVIQ